MSEVPEKSTPDPVRPALPRPVVERRVAASLDSSANLQAPSVASGPPQSLNADPHVVKMRNLIGKAFQFLCLSSTWFGLVILVVLLAAITWQGWSSLNWSFLTSYDSSTPQKAGILAGLWGSFWMLLFTVLFAVPVGVGAALYLEEYAKGTWLTRLIQLNLSNLAGVPSIVYGILGLTVFARMFSIFSNPERLNFLQKMLYSIMAPLTEALKLPQPLGPSVLSGSLTLSLLVLPIVIIATQEALRSIPASLRHASLALGATKWQTIWYQVLPAATPGILTGVILAISRAIGETAPLIMIGIPAYIRYTPGGITNLSDLASPSNLAAVPGSKFTALPMLIFKWVQEAKAEFLVKSAAAIVVLLAFLLLMNTAAILIRHRFQKQIRW